MQDASKNSRARTTRERLYASFLELLEAKSVSDISVVEICDGAGISRKTFYKYYSDQFALLLAMQDDLFVDYRGILVGQPADVSALMPVLVRFVEKNRVLVKAAFANRGEGNFVDRVLDDLFETYRTSWEQANPSLDPNDVEFLFYFAVSGLFGIVRRWLFDRPELSADDVIGQCVALMHVADPHRAAPYPV